MENELSEQQGIWHPVAREDELAPGGMANSDFGGDRIVVYNVDGEFYATDNVCTHAFALLSDGWLEGEIIECPLHAGRFNVRTGQALGDPVECDLRTFPVRIADGTIEVLLTGR